MGISSIGVDPKVPPVDGNSNTPGTGSPSSRNSSTRASASSTPRSGSSEISSKNVDPALVLGNTSVPLAEISAVAVVVPPSPDDSFKYIHANQIEACTDCRNGVDFVRLRCLGQTPPHQKTDGANPSKRDLLHITTLLDQAHKLRLQPNPNPLANSAGAVAQVAQFISPLTFNNPAQSQDRAMSDLIHQFANNKRSCGGYTILSRTLIVDSQTTKNSDSGLTRKFEVKYTKGGEGGIHSLILTEHAPDFPNGLMKAAAITKALKAIEGADPDVMLSYLGVGRVGIMQVVLDVKAQIERARLTGAQPSPETLLEHLLEEAIKKVEALRGPYVSRKPEQKAAILQVLKGIEAEAKTKGANPAEVKAPEVKVPEVKVPDSPVDDDDAISLLGDQDTQNDVSPAVTHVPLSKVPLKNFGNSCYINSAIKFIHCWLGGQFEVDPARLKYKDGKDIDPFTKLRNELEKIVGKLSAGPHQDTTPKVEASLEELINAMTSDDLAAALGKATGVNNPFKKFGDKSQQSASELVTALTEILGVSNLEASLNMPFDEARHTLIGAAVANHEPPRYLPIRTNPPVELELPRKEMHLIHVKPDEHSSSEEPKELKAWIESYLSNKRENPDPVERNFTHTLSEVDGCQISDEQRQQISAQVRRGGLNLEKSRFRESLSLCLVDAEAPSKLALDLQPYATRSTQQVAGQQPILQKKVFDLNPINLNQEIVLNVLDKSDNTKKDIRYKPTAYVFHRGSTMEYGHYFMVAKEPPEKGGKWVMHNDDDVTELSHDTAKAFTSNAAGTGARPTLVLLQSVDSLGEDKKLVPEQTENARSPGDSLGADSANQSDAQAVNTGGNSGKLSMLKRFKNNMRFSNLRSK